MVSITKWLVYGLVGAFTVSALIDPARAQGTIGAFGGIGSALGSLGGGVQSLLTGVGTGTAKLFNPLFTLRDLIYGPQAGVQVQSDIEQVTSTGNLAASQIAAQQQAIELDPAAPFTPVNAGFGGMPLAHEPPGPAGFSYRSQPSISPSPVTQVMVHGQSMPLSAAAISHYQALGVSVSPVSNQTVAGQNSANATSNSSASANYQAGAAQSQGYSTGSPTASSDD
jgi:hypothetical protein